MVPAEKVNFNKGVIMAGKGSKERPTDKKIYDSNFDEIIWNPEKKKETTLVRIKGKKVQRIVYK